MARVFIGVGSNIDREKNIRTGVEILRQKYGQLLISPVYESKSVGFAGENFYNFVIALETDITPVDLIRQLHDIENEFGRDRSQPRYSPRILDLDLLLYDDLVMDDGDIVIPREDVTKYAFVLRPLADIAGDFNHPVLGKSIAELWSSFNQVDGEIWPADLDLQ